MRGLTNPGYFALEELLDRSTSTPTLKHNDKNLPTSHKETDNRVFFILNLPANSCSFMLNGQRYQSDTSSLSHLSVDKFYREKKFGLTPFHFTWYGVHTSGRKVVLHAYFNKRCILVNCHLKALPATAATSNATTLPITSDEKFNVHQYIEQNTTAISVIRAIYNHAHKKYQTANTAAKALLSKLEKLSVNIKQNQEQYIITSRQCIKNLKERNKWDFSRNDPTIALLQNRVDMLSKARHQSNQPHDAPNTKTEVTIATPSEKLHATPQPQHQHSHNYKSHSGQSLTATERLAIIDQELLNNNKLKKNDLVKWAITRKDLLQKKLNILLALTNDESKALRDSKITLFKQISDQQQAIEKLFYDSAIEGRIDDVTALGKFISMSFMLENNSRDSGITIYKLLEKVIFSPDHIAVCQYLMNKFTECSELIDCLAYQVNVKLKLGLLHLIMLNGSELLPMFEMLLSQGIDIDAKTQIALGAPGYLQFAVEQGFKEHAALLLQYGTHIIPATSPDKQSSRRPSYFSFGRINYLPNKSQKTKLDNLSCANNLPLLHIAIANQDNAIVSLLLKHGASTREQSKFGLSAIGQATIINSLAMIKLIITSGANVDLEQNIDNICLTSLMLACEKNYFDSVKTLIALGADPNKSITLDHGKSSSLFIAAANNNVKIVKHLLNQTTKPIMLNNLMYVFRCFFIRFFMQRFSKFTFDITPDFRFSFKFKAESKQELTTQLLLAALLKPNYADQANRQLVSNEAATAKILYSKGNFYPAISHFIVALACTTKRNDRINLCYNIGRSAQQLGRPTIAISFFNSCLTLKPNAELANKAKRYLAELQSSTSPNTSIRS